MIQLEHYLLTHSTPLHDPLHLVPVLSLTHILVTAPVHLITFSWTRPCWKQKQCICVTRDWTLMSRTSTFPQWWWSEWLIKLQVCNNAYKVNSATKVNTDTSKHFTIIVGEDVQHDLCCSLCLKIQNIKEVRKSACDMPELIIWLKGLLPIWAPGSCKGQRFKFKRLLAHVVSECLACVSKIISNIMFSGDLMAVCKEFQTHHVIK